MSEKLRIKKVTDDIILLNMDTQAEISELLIRFQEYYESPIPEIRGKIFTLGYLKMMYSKSTRTERGAFTYHDGNLFDGDWNGFNLPGWVIEPFAKGLFDPLTEGEVDVVELFKYRDDKFYIIGTHNEDGDDYCLDHEILHGLFYTQPGYKEEVLSIIDRHAKDTFTYEAFADMLREWGYDNSVMDDEIQAYVGADYEWLIEQGSMKRFEVTLPKEMHEEIQEVKERYFKPTKAWAKSQESKDDE